MSSPPQFNDYIGTSPPGSPALNAKIMSVAIAIFFLFVLIILMIHLYARLCWSHPLSGRGLAFTPTRHTHIHTGLDKAVIAQLPTFIYKAPSSAADEGDSSPPPPLPLECAVCLSEFQDSDKCTTLPSCKHTFHTECIDMWFFSHSTCPLCRISVIPASTAASPSPMPSSYEQHQGGEHQVAIQASQNTAEGNHGASSPVQYPCNVLFWGNQAQVTSSQDPSSASSPSSLPSLTPPATRSLPQITIDIPPTEGNFGASAAGSLLSNSTTEQAAGSSQAPKSPGLSASLKRMLSRQSSRHRSSNEEGNEKFSK